MMIARKLTLLGIPKNIVWKTLLVLYCPEKTTLSLSIHRLKAKLKYWTINFSQFSVNQHPSPKIIIQQI